jgi:hypothetical protein
MPQITVYIKKDDMPIWKALDNKANWLRHHLYNCNNSVKHTAPPKKNIAKATPSLVNKVEYVEKPVEIKNPVVNKVVAIDPKLSVILSQRKIKTCTHGYAVGLCKFNCRRGV